LPSVSLDHYRSFCYYSDPSSSYWACSQKLLRSQRNSVENAERPYRKRARSVKNAEKPLHRDLEATLLVTRPTRFLALFHLVFWRSYFLASFSRRSISCFIVGTYFLVRYTRVCIAVSRSPSALRYSLMRLRSRSVNTRVNMFSIIDDNVVSDLPIYYRRDRPMQNIESSNEEGRGSMQGERTLPCGVGPDEPKAKSASVRGFESHPPHFLKNPRKFVGLRSSYATSGGVFSILAQIT
jgi:hypothetical protein